MQQIAPNIYKICSDSNVYFLDFAKKIIIDTAKPMHKKAVEKELKTKIDPKQIDFVFFTHLHYDHIGNFGLFENAQFFASNTEIQAWKNDPFGAILNMEVVEAFNAALEAIETIDCTPFGLQVIPTPGHTIGSVCFWYEKEKILFSGDTLFEHSHGRVDLPTSVPKEMMRSLLKLKKYESKTLCAGHDY